MKIKIRKDLMTEARESDADPINYPDSIVGGNLFVPISLGNHYYSLKVLLQVIEDFISKSELCVIVLCDRLRFLSYLIRGEADLDRISRNVRLQLDQMKRVLTKLDIASYSNVIVADWSFVVNDNRFSNLITALEGLVREDREVRRQIYEHCVHLLSRFNRLDQPDAMRFQLQYLIEETALSVYMTEICGYNVELYRRGMGFVDYLYDQRFEALKSITGRATLDRKFVALEHWLKT